MTPPRERDEGAAAAERPGKTAWVLRYGVLGWGLSTALFWTLSMSLVFGHGPFLATLAIAVPSFCIGGFFWGTLMWHWNASRRRRAAQARS